MQTANNVAVDNFVSPVDTANVAKAVAMAGVLSPVDVPAAVNIMAAAQMGPGTA